MGPATHLALSLAALLAARPVPVPGSGPAAPPARAARIEDTRRDPWLGDDKFRHLAMSFASTSFAFAAARSIGMGDAAPAAGAAAALAAGIGKELFDARAGSFFSVRDLAWDVAGALAGYALARQVR